MPSVFLLNAIVLFGGVIAFLIAGFAGALLSSLRPWRYRIMLAPLGFVVCGGICISAQQHLLRWMQHGHLHHSVTSGVVQSIVLVIGGLCGMLAGLGLGTNLDSHFAGPAGTILPDSLGPQRTKPRPRKAKIVPISLGRHAGVVPQIKANSNRD